jgi:pilus assembly protein CpaF
MRPDRLVTGEVRGSEVLDLLQAMNGGLDGMLFTLHANGARDALARLETMATLSGLSLPPPMLREMIAAAVDLIVYLERLRDGSQRILSISEVRGMQGDVILTGELFVFQPRGMEEGRIVGHFTPTGHIPTFLARIHDMGLDLDESLFSMDRGRTTNDERRTTKSIRR